MSNLDVLVVGGGLSGLVAAYTLLQKVPEINILIIEAEGALGGRILSIPMLTSENQFHTFDLGAQWVTSSQPHIMTLIDELGITLIEQYCTGLKVYELIKGEVAHNLSFWVKMEFDKFVYKIETLARNISFDGISSNVEHLDSISMATYVNQCIRSQYVRNLIQTIIFNKFGVSLEYLSVLYYIAFTNSTLSIDNQYKCNKPNQQYRIKGGSYELCHKLLKTIGKHNILLNDPITEINTEANYIKTKSNKLFEATYIILAITPKDVLHINFKPVMTDLKICNTQLSVGTMIKFIITYKVAFWRDKGFSGEILTYDGPILSSYDSSICNHPAISGLAKLDFNVGNCEKEELKLKILEHLNQYWGEEALCPLDFAFKVWNPVLTPNISTFENFSKLRNALNNRIIWAGSETATFWNGYMNGAVQSGRRAAFEVLYSFRPQCISWQDLSSLNPKREIVPKITSLNYFVRFISNASLYVLVGIGIYMACSQFLRKKI